MQEGLGMKIINFGRRKFTFGNGKSELLSTSITVRSQAGEAEEAFKKRLLKMVDNKKGTIEIVIKAGKPDYAIITFK